ncbi:MAG: class I SAM-dependent methyltransferase [Bifidobacteriaceae bacterium]|jgi:hypothetical protein|nr:class I SAM-dependent methyltransferase [Bifidobacteriaceae bacterium]
MDLEDVALLVSEQGRRLLAELPEYDSGGAIKVLEGLRRRGVGSKLAAAALTQSRLRAKARAKFGQFAGQMLFTNKGLEQASRLEVAARHAERYLNAAVDRVVDLTGGIGADALAMAGLGLRVTVYERDPVTAAVARVNLSAFPEARVVTADSLSPPAEREIKRAEALFADPSRRTASGRRVSDPEAYDPPLGRILELARDRPLGVKVAPGIPHRAIPAEAEAEWVSVDGQVVEAGLWFGPLRSPATRRRAAGPPTGPHRAALVIRQGRAHRLHQADGPPPASHHSPPAADQSAPVAGPDPPGAQPGAAPATAADAVRPVRAASSDPAGGQSGGGKLGVGPLREFIYEPDGAVIRASLIAEAAATLGPAASPPTLVNSRIAYVTADVEARQNPFLTGYRVEDAFGWGLKRLRAYLREHGIGQVVVKKRGTAVDPAELRKRLNLKGGRTAVVILTRLGARQSVVIAQPLPTEEDAP